MPARYPDFHRNAAVPSRHGRAGLRRLALPAVGALLVVALLVGGAGRPAQAVTFLEQMERLRLINAALLDYRPGQAPLLPAEAVADFTLEIIPQPAVNNRVGSKQEPINTPGFIPRLRGRYLSPSGWMVGLTASPPLEVQGFTATWLGGEGGLRAGLGPIRAELRLFAISGEVKGPVTEAASKDQFLFTNRGGDLRAGTALGAWNLYAGGGMGTTSTELRVTKDGSRNLSDNDYTYLLAGLSWVGTTYVFTLEQQSTEDYLRHVILAVAYRW